MFLSLELPGGDKGVSLFARDLAGDEGYEPHRSSFSDWDSDRSRANRAINAANRALASDGHKAFNMLFNQFSWSGTTGWEYWSRDYQLMFKHALVVASALKVPLHVARDILERVERTATAAGINFTSATAKPVEAPNDRDFVYTNKEIADGKYVVLSDVVSPGLPVLDEDF